MEKKEKCSINLQASMKGEPTRTELSLIATSESKKEKMSLRYLIEEASMMFRGVLKSYRDVLKEGSDMSKTQIQAALVKAYKQGMDDYMESELDECLEDMMSKLEESLEDKKDEENTEKV